MTTESIEARLPFSGDTRVEALSEDARNIARRIEQVLRRLGLDGEPAFYAVAAAYAAQQSQELSTIAVRGELPFSRVMSDGEGRALLGALLEADPLATSAPVLYQHLLGARFRRNSGKFFTPRSVAASMVRLIPVDEESRILDPACGGGVFLSEASSYWGSKDCKLFGNDVDPSLADLTRLRLALDPNQRSFEVEEGNLYEGGFLAHWAGTIDAIIANPPFSLRITVPNFRSPLFAAGYANSDALFLDEAHRLLRPGGRLVCLLPHSIFVNRDYSRLRCIIEESWVLRAVFGLPEGVFHVTADTATRAGIIVLDKRPAEAACDVVFGHCDSVGTALNARGLSAGEDSLGSFVADSAVRTALGLEAS